MSPDEELIFEIPIRLLSKNLNMIDMAAMALGETRVDAINRACALYYALHEASPGQKVNWAITEERYRVIKILE